jgi:hypothetical protein
MRKLLAAFLLSGTAVAGPAIAADLGPYYPPVIEIPDVNYGVSGGLYLRGSVAGGAWSAQDGQNCGCIVSFDQWGYGYSVGAGFGYDSGHGIRADVTFDYLNNDGLTSTTGHKVNLRSGLALANIYYDFNLSGNGYGAGGFGAYVGAGIGVAKNYSEIMNGNVQQAWGHSLEGAGAVMAGVSYDFGSYVADVGYRGIYMNKVMSQPANLGNAYLINNNFIHELRTSLRYRF